MYRNFFYNLYYYIPQKICDKTVINLKIPPHMSDAKNMKLGGNVGARARARGAISLFLCVGQMAILFSCCVH